MDLALSPEQISLRDELRAYFRQLMSPERVEALGNDHAGGKAYREVIRQLGKDGWLGVGWKKEWGGRGYTPMEQLIFFEEANAAKVPLPFVTLIVAEPSVQALQLAFALEIFVTALQPKFGRMTYDLWNWLP